jgi:hypothetical protein
VIRFWRYKASGRRSPNLPGQTELAYKLEVSNALGNVNARTHKLWRKDSRYPGHVTVYRDPESGGAVLEFDALRHGAKEPRLREVVAPEHVDKLILSLCEIRSGDWESSEGERR